MVAERTWVEYFASDRHAAWWILHRTAVGKEQAYIGAIASCTNQADPKERLEKNKQD